MEPLTLDRARRIVAHAEGEMKAGAPIRDVFGPFAAGGATDRIEAWSALLLMVAQYYRRTGSRFLSAEKAKKRFEDYAKASWFTASRIVSDGVDSPADVGSTAVKFGERYRNFLSRLRSLNPRQADFWPQVYAWIGLTMPEDTWSVIRTLKKLAQ